MTPEELGRRAQEILDNEVFKKAVDDAIRSCAAAWLTETDAVRREGLWHKAQAIDAVAGQLRKLRDNGVVARHAKEREGK